MKYFILGLICGIIVCEVILPLAVELYSVLLFFITG